MNIEFFYKKQINKQTNNNNNKTKTKQKQKQTKQKQKKLVQDNMNKHVHTVLLVKPTSHLVAFSFSSK